MTYSPAIAGKDLIYVSGAAAPGAGDVAGQTRAVIEALRETLQQHGASLERVVAVMVYLRSPGDFQAMNAAYSTFWPIDPPTRTTVVSRLRDPRALVEMSAIAGASGADRTVVRPGHWIASPSPYSYAVRSGDTLFLSGLVSRNGRDNSVVTGDVATQTRVVLDNAGEILHAAGLGFEHVVSSRVFLPAVSTFRQMNDAYAKYFPAAPPSRATVGAALAGSQYAVEMTFVATLGACEPIESADAPRAPGLPLSTAIASGKRLFLSGLLANTYTADAAEQTHQTIARMQGALEAGGSRLDDIVDATIYVTDPANAAVVENVFRASFSRRIPAGTTVIANLVAPGTLVEIAATAVRES